MQDTEQKTTPFHRGEVAIQKRYGVDRVTHEIAKQVIRDYMREQHRQFFAKLPFILVGSVDDAGQPWASILMGEPGFISSPDEHTLTISSQPLYGDPLADVLSTTDAAGRDIGLLGIMLDRSRRNRLNGQISAQTESGFSVQVTQSFGNCPKYIQQRELKPKATAGGTIGGITATKNIVSGASLTPRMEQLVSNSDTLFITSHFSERNTANGDSRYNEGVDVSHRGGKPGFVLIENQNTLLIPDFSGNNHFSTLGNLLLNSKAGLLFIDFNNGDLLYLTGTAEVLFETLATTRFPGAERMIRFTVNKAIHVQQSLPFVWAFHNYSQFTQLTADWK